MNAKLFLAALVLTTSAAAFASESSENVLGATLNGTGLVTSKASDVSTGPVHNCKAIAQIADADIAELNSTGVVSEFLKQATIREANLSGKSTDEILQLIVKLNAEMKSEKQ